MDGQIQGSKLRALLFGRECIPVENWSTTNGDRKTVDSHISIDPTMTKKMRTTGGFGEPESPIPFTQTKIVRWGGPPMKGWDGTIIESWGGEDVSIHLDQIQPKVVQSTIVWRGPPVEGWGGEHESIHLDQIQPKPVEGWGEKRVSIHLGRVKPKGVQSIVVWGGAPVEGWVSKHVSIQLDQIQPEGLQTTEGCGGIQQVTLPEPISSKGTQCADGWGQWAGAYKPNSETELH